MSFELVIALIVITAYLLGSVSFAIVVSRLRGLKDPRTYGSHNPGATNVLRSGDKLAAVMTLFGDAAKGLVGVLLASWAAGQWLPEDWRVTAASLAAFAVFLGHVFPVFFRFQGGKGVATAAGVLLGLDLMIGLWAGLVWLMVARISRISSLAALSAAAVAPILAFVRHDLGLLFWSVSAIGLLLVIRHEQNIRSLMTGKEKSF
jgi:glycerol-3-phosphate acyltransferase PlsY